MDAVRKAVEACGGLGDIIKPGARVLVKPNLVATPESRLSGAVTRWEVTLAVAQLVKEAGGVPFVAESSSVGVDTRDVISLCGYYYIEEAGFPVLDLKGQPEACIPAPDGRVVQVLDSWQPIVQADVIISVPVLKTHDNMEVSLGMKNLKGLVQDTQKKQFHFKDVAGGVVDIVQTLKPALCVLDATYGMEGSGPVFGTPVHMGLILASKDIVACDCVGSVLMGFDAQASPVTAEAYRRGLGEARFESIRVLGEPLEKVKRRFTRSHEVTAQGLPPHILIVGDTTCTGCRNAAINGLKHLVRSECAHLVAGKYIVTGAVQALPEGATPKNTLLIGRCAAQNFGGEGIVLMGCPPDEAGFIPAMEQLEQ